MPDDVLDPFTLIFLEPKLPVPDPGPEPDTEDVE